MRIPSIMIEWVLNSDLPMTSHATIGPLRQE